MSYLPMVIHAEYRGEYRIHLVFSDRTSGEVDCARWLRGPIFAPLRDVAYFKHFSLDGGTLAWPNGADIAPETLYEGVKSNEAV